MRVKVEIPSYLSVEDADPFPYYELLRDHTESGVHWDEEMGAWLTVGHADTARVHRDEETFRHPYWDLPGAVEVQGGARGILMLKGRDHTSVHRFLIRHFSSRVVDDYRARYTKPLVKRLTDRFISEGRVELSSALAEHLPAYVICALLGVSIDDEDVLARCKEWNDDIMRWSETFGEDPAVLEDALSSARNLAAVLMPIIRDREHNPQDDLVSALWREGPNLLENWNEADVLAQARVMLFAGSETTMHLLRNALYLLLDRPDLRNRLREQPELIPGFVEETLRYYGVIHFRIRTAAVDTELSGCPVAAGDRIHPVNSAANRDPSRFDDPGEFRIGRENIKDHLAFGLGPRMCVGANLARSEAIEVVEHLLERLPDLQLDETQAAPRMQGHMPRSYTPLHARWTARGA
jgi:cytochrome P450